MAHLGRCTPSLFSFLWLFSLPHPHSNTKWVNVVFGEAKSCGLSASEGMRTLTNRFEDTYLLKPKFLGESRVQCSGNPLFASSYSK